MFYIKSAEKKVKYLGYLLEKLYFCIRKYIIYILIRHRYMKFSVITVNYNNHDGLRQTMKSVVDQTCCDFEYIVIDGGSTDGSVEVIKEYSSYVHYWVSEPDFGIYHAMNKGVAQAHGDYCLFLNSGDFFQNDMVLELVGKLAIGEDLLVGKVISSKDGTDLFLPPQRDISLYYLYSSTLPHQGTFIKTNLLRKYPYREDLKIVSDWAFFLEVIIFQQCSIIFLDLVVAVFDTEGLSTSSPKEMWKEKEKVLNTLFPTRVLKDYELMKESECLTQFLTPQLREHYTIDKLLYKLGRVLIKLKIKCR